MTSPAPFGDAKRQTLIPGASPVMITEYMPGAPNGALVINTGLAGTVYCGSNSSVQPSTGVPIPGGTSVPWILPGQLWAYLDPATTSLNQDLVVTGDIAGWEPSPLVLATALAAEGIPSVLLQTQLFKGTMAQAPAGNITNLPVASYASLLIAPALGITVAAIVLNYTFTDAAGQPCGNGQIFIAAGMNVEPVVLPVTGAFLTLINTQVATTPVITIDGTNRSVPGLTPSFLNQSPGVNTFNFTGNPVAGTTNLLTFGGTAIPMLFAGTTTFRFTIGGTVAKGRFQLFDGFASMAVTDTAETGWHTDNTFQEMYKTLTIPDSGARFQWQYVSITAPGASQTFQVQWVA